MNRFYKQVSTGPALQGKGYVILLDGRPVRTPEKESLLVPTQALADAIAAEWDAQIDVIATETMPLTQMLTTAIDRSNNRAAIEAEILRYLDSDLLSYRAGEPPQLAAEQDKLWDPWLKWFEKEYGSALEVTFGLSRLDQPKPAHDAVKKRVSAMDHHTFTAFQVAGSLTGSIVLALGMMDDAVDSDTAWKAALCEELFYERVHDLEKHGLDPIEEKRRSFLKRDLEACVVYKNLIRAPRS